MAAPGVPPTPEPPTPIGKQAVIVVHGIGEQRPLETLREFVETVFQRDGTLTPDDDPRYAMVDEASGKINRVWIVPDATAGSNELRRIRTTEHFNDRSTDFYEFYWADLVNNTPLEMVRAWLMGLLIRSPWRIPNDGRIWWSWGILWALSLAFAAGALLLAYPTAGPIEGWVKAAAKGLRPWRGEATSALALLGVMLLVFRARRTKPIRRLKLLAPVVLEVLAWAIYWLAPTPLFGDSRFWGGLIAAGFGSLLAGVIVPYIGDIVRYARATPATVADREAIRNRGLELLRKVHAKLDADGNPEYGRVILVGHSLGCFVAYDLLQLFWYEQGPNPKGNWAMTPAVKDALDAADGIVQGVNPLDGRDPWFDPDAYWDTQSQLHGALVAARQGWLISDLVTLGSPLVHSSFLTHDDGEHLERSLAERMLSASPPRPDLPNNSMLYPGDGGGWPHHGAVFSAVHWTNIFDFAPFPLFGDVVSGAVPADSFGPGVRNVPVTITRGSVPLWRRRFTHTEYWRNTVASWPAADPHIAALRNALNLRGA